MAMVDWGRHSLESVGPKPSPKVFSFTIFSFVGSLSDKMV